MAGAALVAAGGEGGYGETVMGKGIESLDLLMGEGGAWRAGCSREGLRTGLCSVGSRSADCLVCRGGSRI